MSSQTHLNKELFLDWWSVPSFEVYHDIYTHVIEIFSKTSWINSDTVFSMTFTTVLWNRSMNSISNKL